MEEKKAGKRLAQDGSAPRKSRRGLIAVSAVLAALIVVYLALCVWVSASGSTLPRTTAGPCGRAGSGPGAGGCSAPWFWATR